MFKLGKTKKQLIKENDFLSKAHVFNSRRLSELSEKVCELDSLIAHMNGKLSVSSGGVCISDIHIHSYEDAIKALDRINDFIESQFENTGLDKKKIDQ